VSPGLWMLRRREPHMTRLSDDELGKVGYRTYGDMVGQRDYQGDPMPTWEALPHQQKRAWIEAALEIGRVLTDETGPTDYQHLIGKNVRITLQPDMPPHTPKEGRLQGVGDLGVMIHLIGGDYWRYGYEEIKGIEEMTSGG